MTAIEKYDAPYAPPPRLKPGATQTKPACAGWKFTKPAKAGFVCIALPFRVGGFNSGDKGQNALRVAPQSSAGSCSCPAAFIPRW